MKAPELALNETEAKRLAVAVAQVQAQYPLVIDAKTQAWINLAAIGGMIYVPRFISVASKRKQKPLPPRAETPTTPEQAQAQAIQEAPAVAPSNKGPQTPADLFGLGNAGAE